MSKKAASKTKGEDVVVAALSPNALRWRCDADSLPFQSTDDVEPAAGVVGQTAAVEALQFGLETSAPGQNVFVRGLTGTGRLTLVRRLLEDIKPACPIVRDFCYVHHFTHPERPRLIVLPAGRARMFGKQMDRIADFVRDQLRTALASEHIQARRRVLNEKAEEQLKALIQPMEESLREAGLTFVSVQTGPVMQTTISPLVEGKAVAPEEFERLHAQGEIGDDQYKAVRENFSRFEKEIARVSEAAGKLRREHEETVTKLMEQSTRSILGQLIDDVERAFPFPPVRAFLAELVDDVTKYRFGENEEGGDFTWLYRVNVVLEHGADTGCTFIVENIPTMRNLLGAVDPDFTSGEDARMSHLGIRAGSLLRADGGYLILDARDTLEEPGSWKMLLRVLRTGRLEIAPPETTNAAWGPQLKPEAIDLNVKVILIGDPDVYAMLDANDSDFPYQFKVLADFDDLIPRNEAGITHYATVLANITRQEHLRPLNRSAIAALVEQGARIAARAGKLTARFGRLADIAREAEHLAALHDDAHVEDHHVAKAIQRGKRRADLPSRRFRELVASRTIRVDTAGSVVGQVNGLAVLQAGPMIYGFPTRITATIGPGQAGVINIEGEAHLSGAIHTKGFHILGGLLRHLLRTDHPLAFDASIAFEQTYGGIDGDSASGAETCCLLSTLIDTPIRQDLAMTGAIDQHGHILAIGAVNEKIEGFFDICRDLGMTGTQGVIIPAANQGDLMLRSDVVEACAAGRFHIYAVQSVHQALELFTGVPAGQRGTDGRYAKGSLLANAVDRARDFWLKASKPPRVSRPTPR